MPLLRDHEKIESRIYPRQRGGPIRYYGDFRDYHDVGGGLDPLTAPGERYATTNLDNAKTLAAARVAQLEALRQACPTGDAALRQLGKFAAYHLGQKAVNEEADEQWLESAQRHLEEARDYFGDRTDLADIQVRDISAYTAHLRRLSNGRSGRMSSGTVVHYLNSLSNLFRRAISEGLVPMGHNPVNATMSKPKIRRKKTPWLEVHEMAVILEYARTSTSTRADLSIPYFYEILATLALTGCRLREVLGLEVGDVDLKNGIIAVQPNDRRRLKTETSERVVKIFSQLKEILEAYLDGPYAPAGRLFFPALRVDGKEDKMITDLRKQFDRMPMPERLRRPRTLEEMARAEKQRVARLEQLDEWEKHPRGPRPNIIREELMKPIDRMWIPPLRSKMLRHTYCAARLQTLDHGQPISIYTVADEMGHEDFDMIKKVYGHLGKIRHRGEEVEYRI